jgi:hypothetical protein
MVTISDASFINWIRPQPDRPILGLERTICSQALCGSKYLTVYHRTVSKDRQFQVHAGDDYHLVYVIEAQKEGVISFDGKSHTAKSGATRTPVPAQGGQHSGDCGQQVIVA